jgi:hypothetical protein
MDYSMCQNNKCPSRNTCFRFTAIPDKVWQSYSDFQVPEGKDRCEHYWDDTEIREQCYKGDDD